MFPLRDANPRSSVPVVTYLVFGVNVVVFVYQSILGHGLVGTMFVLRWAFKPDMFFEHPVVQLPSLVTSLFLHGGIVHIFGNMLFLLVFADNVEDRMGHGRFLLFYLLGGAVANLGHALFANGRHMPLIGASGAISVVLGAYIVLFARQRILTFIPPLLLPWFVLRVFAPVPRFWLPWLPAWLFLGYWAVIQFAEAAAGVGLGSPGATDVAWWAHVVGFVFGVITIRGFVGTRVTAARGDHDRQVNR